jgi:glutathione S-transferase
VKATPKRLYDYPFSGNGYKIRIAITLLGFKAEYVVIDLLAGESRSPDFLAKNPMGQIPVLELSDGAFLRESNSILYWLTEGTALMPTDHLAKTRVIQWMCFEQSNIDKVLGRTRFLKLYPHVLATTEKDWEQWYAVGNRALGVMETELRERTYLVGDRFSAADICLYGYVHCAEEGGFSLEEYPRVNRWRSEVQKRIPFRIDQVSDTVPPASAREFTAYT